MHWQGRQSAGAFEVFRHTLPHYSLLIVAVTGFGCSLSLMVASAAAVRILWDRCSWTVLGLNTPQHAVLSSSGMLLMTVSMLCSITAGKKSAEQQGALFATQARPNPSEGARRIAAALGDDFDDDQGSDLEEAAEPACRASSKGWTRRGARCFVAGGASNKVASLEEVADAEAIAATRGRLAAQLADEQSRAAIMCSANPSEECEGGIDDFHGAPLERVVLDRGERWDAESCLSLRSNLYNHPGRISDDSQHTRRRTVVPASPGSGVPAGMIKLSSRTGLPAGVVPGASERQQTTTIHEEEGDDGDHGSDDGGCSRSDGSAARTAALVTQRRKGESAEERRVRKAAVKATRREGRASKKELKGIFRAEAARQGRAAAGRAAIGGAAGSTVSRSVYALQ
jgi:hypothetical protein